MTITGLENNYYLSQNNIWLKINEFASTVSIVELKVTNLTTGNDLPIFKLAASLNNDVQFNISQIVSALMPELDHINLNTLQSFQFDFTAKFTDSEIEDDISSLTKFFVFGKRLKNGNNEWYLQDSQELIVGKWIEWVGVTLPGFAKKIQGASILDFIPTDFYKKNVLNCDFRILKFLNSLGGFQYFVFESFEIKTKSKAGKTISKITDQLRKDNFINLKNETEQTIEFTTKTPFQIQGVFTDLVTSSDIFLYNSNGSDDNAKWQRLKLENNDSIENNFDRIYENKIEFTF